MLSLKRLDIFWLHGDCFIRQKINVFNSIIRSKLAYGLEAAQLNQSAINKLDLLQLKGLRKILKMDTTWGNMQQGRLRENTNEEVFRRAKVALKEEVENRDAEQRLREIRRRNTYAYRERLSRETLEQQRERLRIDFARHWAGINGTIKQKRLQKISTFYKERKIKTLGK